MPAHVIVVDRKTDFIAEAPNRLILSVQDYIRTVPENGKGKRPQAPSRVINLCSDNSYLSLGYYCSLLAEARGQKVIPSVGVLLDLHWKRLYRAAFPDLNELVAKTYKQVPEDQTEDQNKRVFAVFFGRSDDPSLKDVARRIFDAFRCPLLSVEMRWRGAKWEIEAIRPIPLREVRPEQAPLLIEALNRYTHAAWRTPKANEPAKYAIALLHDPAEKMPPSNLRALKKFQQAGEAMGIDVEPITRKDFAKLSEYDALFIRETTAIDHHTYRFAKKAVAEGMPVIDDPASIMRCSNKVYLSELLQAHKIATPKTVICDRSRLKSLESELAYPMVLKIPDGAFSRGIHKANNPEELAAFAKGMLDDSDIILAQEFMVTAFDWRVGVLNREPIFVCQYFMAKNHWQVVKHSSDNGKDPIEGGFKAFRVEDAPKDVVDMAVNAANLIGNGLYGVDLKQTANGVFVIEVNDNPNLDAGIEDALLGDELYRMILREFVKRIESR